MITNADGTVTAQGGEAVSSGPLQAADLKNASGHTIAEVKEAAAKAEAAKVAAAQNSFLISAQTFPQRLRTDEDILTAVSVEGAVNTLTHVVNALRIQADCAAKRGAQRNAAAYNAQANHIEGILQQVAEFETFNRG